MRSVSLVTVLLAVAGLCVGWDNGAAELPPMGWSSWNYYHRSINASLFVNTANAIHGNGMYSLGYDYIATDGGWWAGSDTGTIVRNATGYVQVNKDKFPDGLVPVIDHIHSLGMKYGHYTDSGKHACNGDKPMSEGYEAKDWAVFQEWGVDGLKLDACGRTESAYTVVKRWNELLGASPKPIVFFNCHNDCQTDQWQDWCPTLSNGWRTSSDIQATWKKVMYNLDTMKGRGKFGKPGQWNMPDFLEVDNGEFAWQENNQTLVNMNRAHFSLWSVTSSPLIMGNDILNMPSGVFDILANKDAIKVNQQYAGNAGDVIRETKTADGQTEVWYKPLKNEEAAVVMFNRYDTMKQNMNVSLSEFPVLGGKTTCQAKHVWDGKVETVHDTLFATLSPRSVDFIVFSDCQ